MQAETYEENTVSKREVGPMTRKKDTECRRHMATEQELKVAEKAREHQVEIEEGIEVGKQKTADLKREVTQERQEGQTDKDRWRSHVDCSEGSRKTKNMRWRLRSIRLSRLRRKPSLQLRLLTERNKLHTTKKAGQRAAGVVREGIRRESGS